MVAISHSSSPYVHRSHGSGSFDPRRAEGVDSSYSLDKEFRSHAQEDLVSSVAGIEGAANLHFGSHSLGFGLY